MAEYIDREVAKGSLRMNQHRFTCADEANGFGSVKWSEDVIYANAAQKAIDTIQSADVAEVKHGKWEHDTDGLPICSHCGEIALQRIMLRFPDNQYFSQFVHSNFCPHCGARMDGGT